ncbi:hypothetical protein EON80_02555 [bacterium]|nr:MAG: hypothetical protein EON80_02555 [bacterium]
MQSPSKFISLDSIQIASPCKAAWAAMDGDDKSRFCQSCAKNVYDLSAMTAEEARQLIAAKEGEVCVRLHRRADGKVITSDCPVGVSPLQRSGSWLENLLITAVAAIVGVFGVRVVKSMQEKPMVFMGAMNSITTLVEPIAPPGK